MAEDITAKVSPNIRMTTSLPSIVIAFIGLDLGISSLGFEVIDGFNGG